MNPHPVHLQEEEWHQEIPETTLALLNGSLEEEAPAHSRIDLSAPIVLAIAAGILFCVKPAPVTLLFFIGSASYFAGRVVKKLIDDYDFTRTLEEWSIKLVRKIPYIHILAISLTALFATLFLHLAYALASGVGTLSAVTVDTESYVSAANSNAVERGPQHFDIDRL